MQSIFDFFYRFRVTFLFVALQFACFIMVFRFNHYQGAFFFNTSNYYVAVLSGWSNAAEEYLQLRKVNETLSKENARLNALLMKEKNGKYTDAKAISNKLLSEKYEVEVAKIVNKTTRQTKNYLTIEKGTADGVAPNMGVISSDGVVGKVVDCSPHFSTIISILHTNLTISAKVKTNGYVSYIQWEGKDARFVKLKDVPSPIKVAVGDTVITSGYNAYFPPEAVVGIVSRVGRSSEATFQDIDVKLSTDFNSLTYVYVVKNKRQIEQDTLEKRLIESKNIK